MTSLAARNTPSPVEWDMLVSQAETIAKSGLAPDELRNRPEAIVTIGLKGWELGIPPMQALSQIHVIKGKPTLSAELMRALVLRAGHRIWVDPNSDEKTATLHGQRWDEHLNRYEEDTASATFSMEDAERANLTKNPTWRAYPKNMLVARATAILCRQHFADVLMGASYLPEELDNTIILDAQGRPLPDADAEADRFAGLPSGVAPATTDTPEDTAPDTGAQYAAPGKPTNAQFAKFHALLNEEEVDEDIYRAALRAGYQVDSVKELTKGQLTKLIDFLSTDEGVNKFVKNGMDQLADEANDEAPEEPKETLLDE